jgi:hypothetical protein
MTLQELINLHLATPSLAVITLLMVATWVASIKYTIQLIKEEKQQRHAKNSKTK